MTPIAGFPHYSIDRDGRVFRNGRQLKPILAANGYFKVGLWKNNKGTHKNVHRLILETFVGQCPLGCEALHINGNRQDNRLENLRWGTRAENVADMIRHGTATIGSKNGRAKFTRHDVLFMRDMKSMGFTYKEIQRHFPASQSALVNAVKGHRYKDVNDGI